MKKLYVISGLLLIVTVLVVVGLFGSYLTTKVAPGRHFRVLGPTTLVPGQAATITWDASPENVERFPFEKIEYCFGALLRRRCTLLASAAANNGQAVVRIPQALPTTRGYLRFTPRDAQRHLVASISTTSNPVTVKPAPAKSPPSSSGSGGGGSGGSNSSGGNGGSSTVTATPTSQPTSSPTPTATPTPTLPSDFPGEVLLQSITVNNCNVTVAYAKKFTTCAHLVHTVPQPGDSEHKEILHQENMFCDPSAVVTVPLSSFKAPFAPGLTVQLCHGNSYGICSQSVEVTGGGACNNAASAEFMVPEDKETVFIGDALDTRVKLIETDSSKIACQEWLLNGVSIPQSQWVGGQSPDLSVGPCQ